VYDLDREGDTRFMVMEFVEGEPLDVYLKRHPKGLSQEDALSVVRGMCEAFKVAHASDILHGEFSPGYIFYARDKMAKVFDFGVAQASSNWIKR
jgi:serine/threonine protein kinase